ncbi:MAG: diacylglycerol kinase family protein [Bacteroidota bacterium]
MSLSAKARDYYIILNPAAGRGSAQRKWPLIERGLKKRQINYQLVLTSHANQATQLTREGIAQGYRYIMAIGGDGTNNEVINGIIDQQIVPSKAITYALMPIGTGNDWVRSHGIPKKIDQVLDLIIADHCAYQDIGLVHYEDEEGRAKKRYFANVAGMAYDAYVVRKTAQGKSWLPSKLLYLWVTIKCLFQYQLKPAIVQTEQHQFEDYFYTINVGICRYSGGGMQFVPHAVPDDGQLAVTLAGRFSILEVLLNSYLFYTGTLHQHPKIEGFYCQSLSVHQKGTSPILLEVDGEFLGHSPVRFELIKQALRFIAPTANSRKPSRKDMDSA